MLNAVSPKSPMLEGGWKDLMVLAMLRMRFLHACRSSNYIIQRKRFSPVHTINVRIYPFAMHPLYTQQLHKREKFTTRWTVRRHVFRGRDAAAHSCTSLEHSALCFVVVNGVLGRQCCFSGCLTSLSRWPPSRASYLRCHSTLAPEPYNVRDFAFNSEMKKWIGC